MMQGAHGLTGADGPGVVIRRAVTCALVFAVFPHVSVFAGEAAFGFGYAGEHSSNINGSATDATSAWAHSVIAGLGYREDAPELAASVRAQGEYRKYRPEVYADGSLYFVDAAALWTIWPERFTWSVTDRYDYGLLNPTLADTPANRTSYNAFETGPDFYLRFGARNRLSLGARHGDLQYSDVESSNRRETGMVRWFYEANSSTELSANLSVTNVDYENDTLNVDYRRRDGTLKVDSQRGRSRFELEGGHTTIERDRGGTVKGPLWRVNWIREITAETDAGIFLASEWFDAGVVALASATDPTALPGTVTASPVSEIVSSDIFRARAAEAFYQRRGGDLTTDVRLFSRDLDYEISLLDQRLYGGHLRIEHNPQGMFSTHVFGSRTARHYREIDEDDVDREFGAGFQYRATRHVSLVLEGTRFQRSSTNATLEYTDDRLFVSVFYSSGPLFTPAPRR